VSGPVTADMTTTVVHSYKLLIIDVKFVLSLILLLAAAYCNTTARVTKTIIITSIDLCFFIRGVPSLPELSGL